MSTNEEDVAELLNIDKKRANDILQMCYVNIAQMQEAKENKQIGKSIRTMQAVGKTDGEHFYTGFVLGRIVQTHMIANFGLKPFLTNDLTHIEKAKNGFKEHPEFG